MINTHGLKGCVFIEDITPDKNMFNFVESERVVDDSQYHPTTEFSTIDTSGSGGEGVYDFYSDDDIRKYDEVDLSFLHSGRSLDINEVNAVRKKIMADIESKISDEQSREVLETAVEQISPNELGTSVDSDSDNGGTK